MNERWIEHTKKADFDLWSRELDISPLSARLMRNRGITTLEEARLYLYGTMADLNDPLSLKGMKEGAALLSEAVRTGVPVAIASDFDDDGIFAGEILYEGIRTLGGTARLYTPDRVREGYGINRRIIDEAKADGCRLILTCDNGIAAGPEVLYAKEQGLKVVVTDHHEVQFTEDASGNRTYLLPDADAVIDPKQPGCTYPFKDLCGAGVALRLISVLYEEFGVPKEELEKLYEYAAIATVADVVPLQGENRIIVKEGLARLRETKKPGLRALMDACGIEPQGVDAYHIGFIIGPCFNAAGRLSGVRPAFDLLHAGSLQDAAPLAESLRALNEERKKMTEDGFREAEAYLAERGMNDRILLIELQDTHESVVGIIAGRLKEKYNRPVIVFTHTEEGLKGSGRSIPEYHMMNGLMPHKALTKRLGGHAMAAGMTIGTDALEPLREALNSACTLTEDDLLYKRWIDALVPMSALSERMIRELEVIGPFGVANVKPVFAMTHFKILEMRVIGKNRNSLKMLVADESGVPRDALYFNEAESMLSWIRETYGEEALSRAMRGLPNSLDIAFCYYPSVNEYMGQKSIQIVIQAYCRIAQKRV
ncbi:MAG: single-stranded-DNA-specific exonuclease RecJ [Lachnospiraceae bacterium]|nr:single-stranded-DNA-specific exonuclease RecJ [Lachnospiraceae bacterium]